MNTIYKTVINKISIPCTTLSILILTSIRTPAQTVNGVEEVAEKTTVQINTDANPGGSGVIIKKEGNIYTVLTANHVVCDNLGRENIRCRTDFTYTIRTYDGREYPIKKRQILQTKLQDPDLAIVTFESSQEYQIAELGNSNNIKRQSDIFVAGFPTIFGRVGKDRTLTITNGKVVAFVPNPPQGYGLIYDAITRIGNSGGPVFDTSGNVVGIHGLADTDAIEGNNINQSETTNSLKPNISTIRKLINPQAESGSSFLQKTGFNAGIPINLFLSINKLNQEVTESKNRDSIAYLEKGRERRNSGDNKGAIDDFTQALKLDPNNAITYYDRGAARYNLGDNKGAIDDYNQALKLDPNYAHAYIGRGNARYNLGDNKGAIDDYNQAIKLDPKNALAYYNRGFARSNLGDNQGAIDDYNQAIKLDPKDADAYYNRGNARSNLGDNQGAID
ncbi:MAG: serine protease, partial [Cylindrospermopsis raciborskii KL1]|nr:serine protease [Cylindrospermopsis raciborskii KL1]